MRALFLFLIKFYQKGISPFFPPRCRYTPTCSQYGLEAIRRYGAWKGGRMFLRRFASCRPGGGSGYDPVP